MSDYRLYWIRDGHFYRREEIEADSDEAAIAEAERRQPGAAAELWTGARKVRLLSAAEAPAESPS